MLSPGAAGRFQDFEVQTAADELIARPQPVVPPSVQDISRWPVDNRRSATCSLGTWLAVVFKTTGFWRLGRRRDSEKLR